MFFYCILLVLGVVVYDLFWEAGLSGRRIDFFSPSALKGALVVCLSDNTDLR